MCGRGFLKHAAAWQAEVSTGSLSEEKLELKQKEKGGGCRETRRCNVAQSGFMAAISRNKKFGKTPWHVVAITYDDVWAA